MPELERKLREITDFLPLHPKDYMVLFALSDGERHGYGLLKDIETHTDGVIKFDPSNLYRSMKRLIDQDLVIEAEKKESPEADNQRRRYYKITPFGRNVLQAESVRIGQLAAAAKERNLIPGTGG